MRNTVISALLFVVCIASLAAQQPVKLVDNTGTDVPLSTTTEIAHDAAIGTLTSAKGLMDFCRALAGSPSAVSTDDDAVLGWCNLLGARAGFLVANAAGGATPNYYISTASNNSTSIKGSAGQLYSLVAINTTAAFKYIRLYNTSSAPTCTSSTGVVFYAPIPASTTNPVPLVIPATVGKTFTTGIGFCITGGSGVTDNTSTAAGDVIINYDYK